MTKDMRRAGDRLTKKLFPTFGLMLAVVFLGGCAGGVQMLPTLTEKTQLAPQEGVVVARFVNTSSYPLPFNYLTISPKNLNESDKIKPLRLTSLDSVATESMIFAAPVKAGSYSLDSVYSFHARGDYFYSRWAVTDANFGTFEVKPGQVTDLGTIIYYPKPQEEKYINEFTRIAPQNPAQTLQSFFPFYPVDAENVIGWNDEGMDDELQDKFISIAQNPVTYEATYKGQNGDVYFIGKLGVIVKRDADGDWSLDAVDTIVDMNSMVQSKEGHLLIAGNEGQAFIKQPQADEWQAVSLSPDLNIEQLYIHDGIYVDALAINGFQVQVYRANLLEPAFTWSKIATYKRDDTWWDRDGNVLPEFIKEKEQISRMSSNKKKITSVGFDDPENPEELTIELAHAYVEQVFGNTTTRTFAVDLDNWHVTSVSADREFSRIRNAGFTKVGVKEAGFWSWSGIPDYFVFDAMQSNWLKMNTSIVTCKEGYEQVNASTCKAIDPETNKNKQTVKTRKETFRFVSLPWFKNADEATAIVALDGERVVIHSHNKGASWEVMEAKLPNEFCSTLVGDINDSLILSCSGATGDFYQSHDMGLSWELVREHQNF